MLTRNTAHNAAVHADNERIAKAMIEHPDGKVAVTDYNDAKTDGSPEFKDLSASAQIDWIQHYTELLDDTDDNPTWSQIENLQHDFERRGLNERREETKQVNVARNEVTTGTSEGKQSDAETSAANATSYDSESGTVTAAPAKAAAVVVKKKRKIEVPYNDVGAQLGEATAERALAQAAADEHTIPAARRPSVLSRLKKSLARFDKTENVSRLVDELSWLTQQLLDAKYAKQDKAVKPRVRGADFIRQKLLEAKLNGSISAQEADFAEWVILKNPAAVDDLGISIRTGNGDASGMYNPIARIITIFKEHKGDTTAVHEVLHHLERLMPQDMQREIITEWQRSMGELLASDDAERVALGKSILEANAAPSNKTMQAAINNMTSYSDYHLLNPSEFWAVKATESKHPAHPPCKPAVAYGSSFLSGSNSSIRL